MTGARPRLVELAVTDLGIIDRLALVLGPGTTALTGETGAGKTMVVGAIDLLLGGRADPAAVRAGAAEAVVEGRFATDDGEELVLSRVVPADGRSRAYVDGRMVTAAGLAEVATGLVDLHGQHAHQQLLTTATQREALDRYGKVDLAPLEAARAERRELEAELAGMGGDAGARAREADLLRFQLDELDAAGLDDPDEDEHLDAEEDVLGDATEHRLAAAEAVEALTGDGGVLDALGAAVATLDGRAPFAALATRLRDASAEVGDVAAELRTAGEGIEDDPERLAQVRDRRQLLVELRRKYATAPLGDGSTGAGRLADVLAYRDDLRCRLAAIEGHDARAAELEERLAAARAREAEAAARVGRARRRAAAPLAAAVEANLGDLAMPAARLAVEVGEDDPGDAVAFLLAANPGAAAAPLAKVASGGELARTMLALRLVLTGEPSVLVFDEVDAGIGGSAALAVGRALAALGARHQVLVVTHLPQVAAFADRQVRIAKRTDGRTTVTGAEVLDPDGRVEEVARMLSGTPDNDRVRLAARELLDAAAAERGR